MTKLFFARSHQSTNTIMSSACYWALREQQSFLEEQNIKARTHYLPIAANCWNTKNSETLSELDKELKEQYNLQNTTQSHSHIFPSYQLMPRARLLLFLRNIIAHKPKHTPLAHYTIITSTLIKRSSKVITSSRRLAGATDIAWGGTSLIIPEKITKNANPLFFGILSGLYSIFEIYDGIDEIIHHKSDSLTKTTKALMVTIGIRVALALACLGLNFAYLVSFFGLAYIAGAALFPIIIPTILTVISSVKLTYLSIKLHAAKKRQLELKHDLNEFYQKHRVLLDSIENKTQKIHQEKLRLLTQFDLAELIAKPKRTPEEQFSLNKYISLCKKQDQIDSIYTRYQIKKSAYDKAKKIRLSTEREVSFETLACIISIILTISSLLWMTSIFGAAGVLSFGTIPLALCITGILADIALSAFSALDNKFQHRPTLSIREKCVNFLKKISAIFFEPKSKTHLKQAPPKTIVSSHLKITAHKVTTCFLEPVKEKSLIPAPQPAPYYDTRHKISEDIKDLLAKSYKANKITPMRNLQP